MIVPLLAAAVLLTPANADAAFDSSFAAYGRLLRHVVHDARVDYQALKADRAALDAVVRWV